ncbi:right-handed parallel beta-helix repeat-containing protein, partial [Methanobrevibacter sp.]
MKIKLAFVVTFLLLLFLGVGLVSASDNMDNSIGISDNADSLKTTSNNDIAIDDVEENNDNDDTVSNPTVTNEKNDGEKLKSNNDILNYSSLNETINSNSSDLIELEHDYVYNDADDSRFIALGGILVSRDLTIDGQGHYIDLGGKLRFISTWGHHITLKNIKILNGYDQWNGGGAVAIWGDAQTPGQGTFIDMEFSNINGSGVYIKSGTGTFERTKFTSCEGIGDTCQGAAVYIEGEGNFIDSIFDKNKAYQGTVFINGYASFNNCNFTDNEGIFGGAARIMGNVSFSNSRFSNNKADTEGGAASIVGQATITDSIFEGNQGPTGGALAIYGNDNSFTKTTFDDNTATSYGGAVAIWGNNNTFIEVKSNRNKVTSGVGGALYIEGNDTNIKNSEFDGNIAGTDGGAVYILNEGNECNINIEKSNFTNNSADLTSSGNGGAVYVKGCTFVDSCNFINNGAYYGGAFRAWNFASINNTKFDANYAIKDGGAASINGYANITNSNFNENKAYKCGALSLYSQNEYVLYLDYLDNNVFTSNIANTTYGGAVAIWGQNIQFTNNNLTNNKAVSKGGAVYIYGNASIINSILNENEAEDGGAIFL